MSGLRRHSLYSVGMPAPGTAPLSEAHMWGLTMFDQMWCRIQFKRIHYQGEFTPALVGQTSLIYPSLLGGMNWGGVSVDESRGLLIVNDIRLPYKIGLAPRDEYNRDVAGRSAAVSHWPATKLGPESPYGLHFGRIGVMSSPLGSPCNEPPWGTLTAIDLASKDIVWQIPMGTTRDTGPLAIPFAVGLPTLGGSVVTRSGLIFFAGTQDYYLRAIAADSGQELWKARLPVGAQATPMTYVAPDSGRQYVVIVAGGAPQSSNKGDYVIAYALGRGSGHFRERQTHIIYMTLGIDRREFLP